MTPVLAFVAGATGRTRRAASLGTAASAAWAALLGYQLAMGNGAVPRILGGLSGLPSGAATALAATLSVCLAFGLAWSAATVGQGAAAAVVAAVARRRAVAGGPGAVTLPPRHAAPAPPTGLTAADPP